MRRTVKESLQLRTRLLAAAASDKEITPTQLAARFGCSHVTVRKYLREGGLYRVVGQSAEAKLGAGASK